MFYTYLWLREDGTPYYVGKGHGKRAYIREKWHNPPKDKSRIVLQHWIDEDTAYAYEIYQIDFWGRKDLGTGILQNRSDGVEKPPNYKGFKRSKAAIERQVSSRRAGKGYGQATEHLRRIGRSRLGSKLSEEHRAKISTALKGRTQSEEHRRNARDANKGYKRSLELRARISASLTGRKRSEEAKRKTSESLYKFYALKNKNLGEKTCQIQQPTEMV